MTAQLADRSMKVYSYVIIRDFGFAPNPFGGVLTLATCKPKIRKNAKVGDLIIGNSNKETGNLLVYMAKVSEILTFDEYWDDPRFLSKRPRMNGSTKKLNGDNIYHHDSQGNWIQEDSHHSLPDGSVNQKNLERDTGSTDKVLICEEFFYFGGDMIKFPDIFKELICTHRGYSTNGDKTELGIELWNWLEKHYPKEVIGWPASFKSFKRYDGVS